MTASACLHSFSSWKMWSRWRISEEQRQCSYKTTLRGSRQASWPTLSFLTGGHRECFTSPSKIISRQLFCMAVWGTSPACQCGTTRKTFTHWSLPTYSFTRGYTQETCRVLERLRDPKTWQESMATEAAYPQSLPKIACSSPNTYARLPLQ